MNFCLSGHTHIPTALSKPKRRKRRKALTLLLSLSLAGSLLAQSQKKPYTLEEIVVTATRVPEARKEGHLPAPASHLSKEAIEEAGVASLPEALSLLEGFHLTDTIGFGYGDARLHLRGAGEFDQGLTLLEGVPLNDPADNSVEWREFPVEVLDSVEVLRGGVSSTFGETLSGVVQLKLPEAVEEPKTTLRTGYGTFGRKKVSVTSLLGDEQNAYVLYAGSEDIGGYRAKSDFAGKHLFFSTATALSSKSRLKIVGNFFKQKVTSPGALSQAQVFQDPKQPGSFTVVFHSTMWHFSPRFDQKIKGVTLSLLPYFRKWTTGSLNNFGTKGTTDTSRLGAILQLSGKAGKVSYTAGVEAGSSAYENALGQSPKDIVDKDTQALFAEALFPAGPLSFSTSLRFDRADFDLTLHECGFDPNTGTCTYPIKFRGKKRGESVSPKLGIAYNPSAEQTLYINFSRSFLTPTGFQFTGLSAPFLANPEVRPQVAKEIDLGWRGKLSQRLKGSLNLFAVHTDREILFDPETFANENFDTRRLGIESSLSYATKKSSISLAYTFLSTEFDQHTTLFGTDIDGKTLPLAPKHRFTLRATRKFGPWDVSLNGTTVSSFVPLNDLANFQTAGSYSVWNLQLSRKIPQGKVFVQLNNLTNAHYSSFPASNGRDPAQDDPNCPNAFSCRRDNFRPLPALHINTGIEWKF